jgi:DNA-binding NarL/FixJ family response regulator
VSTTVLVADDHRSLRDLVRMTVEMAGWAVVGQVENGLQAVHAAYELAPDVIVLDEQMPVLGGMAALPKLRRASPTSRIVMWSHERDIAAEALAAGASAVVDKRQPLEHLLIALALVAPTRTPFYA